MNEHNNKHCNCKGQMYYMPVPEKFLHYP